MISRSVSVIGYCETATFIPLYASCELVTVLKAVPHCDGVFENRPNPGSGFVVYRDIAKCKISSDALQDAKNAVLISGTN